MSDQIRVLLVEDDLDLSDSIKSYLSLAGFFVTAVNSGLNYYKALAESTFHVAIIDINLPDQSGLVLAEFTRKNTQMAIIILTARDTLQVRIDSYEKGSDLFLAKPVDCQELAAAIKSLVARRITPSDNNVRSNSEKNVWILERCNRQLVSPDGKIVPLTGKEYQLLELLATAPGESIQREHILEHLYPRDDEYTNRSLDTLVSRMRNKIVRLSGLSSPIFSVYGVGYSFSAPLNIQ